MLNQTEAKKLLTVGRRKYTEEEKDAALKYFLDHECTLEEAAQACGMSTQTLSIHRQKTLEARGLVKPKEKKARNKKAS